MLSIALKSLWARKFRLVAVSVAILLGVAFMSGTLVLTSTMNKNFNDLFASAYKGVDAAVRGHESFSDTGPGAEAQRPAVPESLIDVVSKVPGVRAAHGGVQGMAQVVDKKGKPIGAGGAPTFGGIWNDDAQMNPFRLSSGTAPRSDDDIVIDYAVAKKAHYVVGDRVPLVVNGVPRDFRLSGIARFGEAENAAGSTYVLFTKAAAQRYVGTPGEFDIIEAAAAPGVSQDQLRSRIESVVGSGYDVVTGKKITEENQNQLKQALKFFNIILLTFAGISLFVGVLIIYNVFSILVAQRLRESALLRAIGATRRQVSRMFVVEAFFVGVVAGALGLVGGIALAQGLQALLSAFGIKIPTSGTVIPTSAVVASFVVGIVASVLSAWLPARRAGRVPPVAALRDVAIDRSGASKVRLLLGALILAAGVASILVGLFGSMHRGYLFVAIGAPVTFLGMIALSPIFAGPVCNLLGAPLARTRGVAGVLARQNARRNPKRTASTAVALMVGVGLVGFMVILSGSIKSSFGSIVDKTFSGDFVVQPASQNTGFSPSLTKELSEQPEVRAAVGFPSGIAEIAGSVQPLFGADMQALDAIVDPQIRSGKLRDLGGDGIAVSKNVADDHHWQVGQKLDVRFTETGAKQLVLRAIYDNDEVLGHYLVSSSLYDANFPHHLDVVVLVAKSPGATADATRAAVDRVASHYPGAKVQDRTEFKADMSKQIDQVLGFVVALLALAIVIAFIGIAITLSLSVYERTHEIGLLRAVGMTRRQARSTVRLEAVLVALYGTLLGLVVAVFFGVSLVRALHDQGVTELTVPVGRIVIIAVVAALSGVVAAAWPARRAARLNVLEAISVE